LSKFGEIFVILKFFGLKDSFFCSMGSALARSLLFGALARGKLYIFGFFMKIYECLAIAKAFH